MRGEGEAGDAEQRDQTRDHHGQHRPMSRRAPEQPAQSGGHRHRQQEREAIDTDVVADGGVGDPADVLLELEAAFQSDEVRG